MKFGGNDKGDTKRCVNNYSTVVACNRIIHSVTFKALLLTTLSFFLKATQSCHSTRRDQLYLIWWMVHKCFVAQVNYTQSHILKSSIAWENFCLTLFLNSRLKMGALVIFNIKNIITTYIKFEEFI